MSCDLGGGGRGGGATGGLRPSQEQGGECSHFRVVGWEGGLGGNTVNHPEIAM